MRPSTLSTLATLALVSVSVPATAQRAYDSAGVRINDYRSPLPAPPELRLTLLKEFAGGPDSATMTASPTAMLRLADGRFAVAVIPPSGRPAPPPGSPLSAYLLPPDAPPLRIEIRLYDSSGKYIRSIGRAGPSGGGRGGGDFSGAVSILAELPGNRIAAGQASHRWAVLTDAGDVVGASWTGGYAMYGALSDGLIVLGTPRAEAGSDILAGESHFLINTMSFHVVDPGRREQSPLGFMTRQPSMYLPPADSTGWSRVHHVSYPVSTQRTLALGGDVFWTINVFNWEAQARDRSDKLHAIIRMPIPPNAVNARFGVPYPADSAKQFRIVADDLGRFWIDDGKYSRTFWNGPFSRGWTVYERDGRRVHTVTMPEGFYPFHFGRDFVLGRRGDVVALYSLR
jgi:hypothetical protein